MRAPFRQWGVGLDAAAVEQLARACELPVAVRGALMPDAHVGYGLPIGGVLATRGAVIPYAVGVDIACRVRMTVLDLPAARLDTHRDVLARALEEETRFGVGAAFDAGRRDHPVLEQDWSVSPVTHRLRDRAWAQLGTSGSGNHFVEFGVLELDADRWGLGPGPHLALLSHSGSRGTGAAVCQHYSRLAQSAHPSRTGAARHLAWLSLDHDSGREYWAAMELMGQYAAANHACIHEAVLRHLGARSRWSHENHHNFAWLETHGGERLVVHRKGATPAGTDAIGIIPGSMTAPTFVVRGRGCAASLDSAAHGAGRRMSRNEARRRYDWVTERRSLEAAGVLVLSAGLDEVPGVYKDIHQVMAEQADLVESLGCFRPRVVRMSPDGERAED